MSWKPWKSCEKEAAELLGGMRRIRVAYSESVEDVIHEVYSVEVKYGKQVSKYLDVDVPTVLNEKYLLIPSEYWGQTFYDWNHRSIGYDLTFVKRGLEQAAEYNPDKIPLLCVKRPRMRGVVLVLYAREVE